ncbi:alginate lyase family protein [Alloacidobacterium dinghuense]|uniref:Alginate lyase family protein n=1 Tax=Alloacidobacterium dinghuense TaxID=2763107 RepID=A0A7G8BK68_9BACT|nr:alginate lyase family protein [Alloacidobacterium dinghuense]QNI32938.1 alginate lyase family protein [Alloacidobacterium dinghuense]
MRFAAKCRVKQSGAGLVLGVLSLLLILPIQAESKLRSPWDGHAIKLTDLPYACPAIVHLSADLTTSGFYSDSKSSVIDPEKWKAYAATSGPYKDLGNRIVDAADAYQTTGSRNAVDCALQHMDAAAKDGVFTGKMSSNQAYYVQGWVIGAVAIAYLKVRESGLVSVDEQKTILAWIENVVAQSEAYFEDHRKKSSGDAQNNHLYWAGVEVAAAGIAANDRKLFDWGMETYQAGISQIQPDGSLPQEMRRGQRALHYHLYALAPLVYLAEFGEENGFRSYADRDYAIKKLAKLCIDGLGDNSFFVKATGIPQDTPNGPPAAEQISWARIYLGRFPDLQLAKLLDEAKSMSYMYLGGLPPAHLSQAETKASGGTL